MSANPLPTPDAADALVDRQLRGYFRGKLPASFPALPLDASQPASARGSSSLLSHGRIVLAICVAVLLFGLWYLLDQNGASRPRPSVSPAGLEAKKPAPTPTLKVMPEKPK